MDNTQKWIAFSTIVRREIHRFMRIWPVSYTHLTLPTKA